MNRSLVGQTFLSAGSGNFPVARPNAGLESPGNPAARDWKACPTSEFMVPMRGLQTVEAFHPR
jgi:hypothetical protein